MKKFLLVSMILMFVSLISFGQSGTTGSIKGTVKSADGEVLPGILVTLTSPAIVLKQLTTVTNENGVYRFHSLHPGTYQLKYQLEGMQTIVRKGIIATLGKTMSVDIKMSLKSLTEDVVVEGKAPTIDRQHTTGASSMNLKFLKSIPAPNRSITNYFNMTPGVTGDIAHGSSNRDNAFQLDGVNVNDPARGDDYVSVSVDIMEEMSVETGGITAEQGSVRGAVVNVVTKSGGNNFSGSLSFLYNHESLQSKNTKGTDLYDPDDNTKVGQKFKMEPGITLGGSIIKDKLWFFTAFSMVKAETYAPGFPHDKEKDIAADNTQIFPYLKLTYQPTQSDKFTFSVQHSNNKSGNRGASKFTNEEVTRIQKNPQYIVNGRWTKNFGSNLYANLKIGYINSNLSIRAKQPGTQFQNYTTNFSTGSAWRNIDDNIRNRFSVNLDVTTFIDDLAGSHEIKFGGELGLHYVNWLVNTITNDTDAPAFVLMAPKFFGNPGYFMGYFIYGYDRKDNLDNWAFFLQDTWSILENLTLNIGVRYEHQSNRWPVQKSQETEPFVYPGNGTIIDRSITKDIIPLKWDTISPRFGLIYDMLSDGSTLVKVSYSKYFSQAMTEIANTAHPNGWYGYSAYLNHDTGAPISGTERVWSMPSTTTVGHPDLKLSAPYTTEFTFGIERELWEDWSMGIRYIKKWDRNLIENVDAKQLDINKLIDTGEIAWINYEKVTFHNDADGKDYTFYNDLDPYRDQEEYIMNPKGATRDYDGIEVTLSKRYSHGWAFNASYVYNNARGFLSTSGSGAFGRTAMYADPNAHVNNEGRFPNSRPHQFKFNGLVRGPLGINLSCYFLYQSGARYTKIISTNKLVGLKTLGQGNGVINIEKRGSSSYPNYYQLDLKIEKEFKISNISFSVFADAFNVFNTNISTEYYTVDIANTKHYLETTKIQKPRVLRLGVKLDW